MDTTFKTNRFHWPLLLVCGINEHFHTVLFAVALVRYQTTVLFAWVLNQMKKVCGDEGWSRVSCVATDGDKAMAAAIEEVLPSSRHLRCWFHIEQNLRHNLVELGSLSMEDFNTFIVQWKLAALMDEEVDFQAAKERLHEGFPMAVDYLTNWIWPHGDAFLSCRTKSITTLGILSTQRVEGVNSTLKNSFQVGSKRQRWLPYSLFWNTPLIRRTETVYGKCITRTSRMLSIFHKVLSWTLSHLMCTVGLRGR
jgi:hypothetical protein